MLPPVFKHIIQYMHSKDHLQTIYKALLHSDQQRVKTAPLHLKKTAAALFVFFCIFETLIEVITNKHFPSIYIEQATTLAFKPRSYFAIFYFKNSLPSDRHALISSSNTVFGKKNIFPNPSNQN